MAEEMTRRLHFDAVVVDGHSDVFADVTNRRLTGETHVLSRLHVPAWRAGGVNVVVTALWVDDEYKRDRALYRAVTLLGAALNDIAETPDVVLCTTRATIDAAVAHEQIAFVLGIEGGECIQGGIESLRVFHQLGVRVLGLTWKFSNLLAEDIGDERVNGGLTTLGRVIVAEANRLGILLDVSHLSVKSFWDLLETSTAPVIASHSSAKALSGNPRNLDDEQIRALAAKGGTIGINLVAKFIAEDPDDADSERVLDHIDHIAGLVGPEHIALGPDYVDYLSDSYYGGNALAFPRDMPNTRALPLITAGLVRRGYDEATIRGILGENFLRVLTSIVG